MIITDELTYFSIFSGIGGFECGIKNSNIPMKCVGFSEVDDFAISIYLRHFPTHQNFGDATKIKTKELPDFDFMVGGFPCQPFSNAGWRRGFDDIRGTVFFEIVRILKDKRPKYFLFENVRGLLYNNNGETFKRILRIFADLGYYVKWEVLSSKENGKLPQKRERVFLRGYLREKCGGEILFNHGNYEQTFSGSEKYSVENKSMPHLKIRETTKKGFKEAYPFDGVLLNRTGRVVMRGMVQNECVGTLPTHCAWGVVTDDYNIRRLTPLEWERLQGFEDNYTLHGKDGELISDTQRYKCLGNAVTVPVVSFIINKMFEDLMN